jgi:hypothetical protein
MARSLTRAQFEHLRSTLPCVWCGKTGLVLREPERDYEGGGVVTCPACGKRQFSCPKDLATPRRPRLKSGTLRQVWEAWGNYCVSCNMTAEQLDLLGQAPTVQHVPRWKEVGEEGWLVPMCSGCNGHGEARHRERMAIIGRIGLIPELAAKITRTHVVAPLDAVNLGLIRQEEERKL